MKLSQESSAHIPWHIDAYRPGELIINKQIFKTAVLIHREFMAPWSVSALKDLNIEILKDLNTRNPELILIGTGSNNLLPSRELLNFAHVNKLGLEIMPTTQACRTYNLMASDGRNVLAALMV